LVFFAYTGEFGDWIHENLSKRLIQSILV
jgi:hypothetical protein